MAETLGDEVKTHSGLGVAALVFAMLSGMADLSELLQRQHRLNLRHGGTAEFIVENAQYLAFILAAISVKLALSSVHGKRRWGFKILGLVASILSVVAAVAIFAYQDIGYG